MKKNDVRVVSNFILQALKAEDITVYGDGSQTKSFQFIDDPKRRRPDVSLAKSILYWSPIIDLETGLQKTINYFNNH